MERPIDCKAGYKHHVTNEYLKHMQKSLMDLCQREFLHQVDLLSPSRTGVNEAEYWAQRRGQRRLDHANAKLATEGQQPTQTVYQTELDKLRKQIYACIKNELRDNFLRKLRLLSIAFHSIHDKNCSIAA